MILRRRLHHPLTPLSQPNHPTIPRSHNLTLLVLLLLTPSFAFSQGRVEFAERSHDFGVIEEGVEAAHTFTFTNTGDAPVTLVDVRPSCGCTTPTWTREPVAPGASGDVTAVYHSEGRPGPFDKGITIHTDGEPEVLQLRIQGEVSPVELAGVRIGNLIVEAATVSFPRVRVGPPAVASFRIQNAGDTTVQIDSVLTGTPALFTDYADRLLRPGRTDEITLILDTDGLTSGQAVAYEITLVTNDAQEPNKPVSLRGTVE